MPTSAYDRLSFLDSSFLLMETPTSPMHIAGIATFEAGPLQTSDGGIDIDKIRDYVASRLHLIPRYRQRLAHVPMENHPVWVDDEHFNIHYHLRHIALPKPGDERQLKRLAARVMAQHLDRQKPLWEIWILEGLANPAHFVMISKIHHCMVDGMSSVDLLNVLLKAEPTEACDHLPRWIPRPAPTRWDLATDALGRYARLPVDVAKSFPQFLQEARRPGLRHPRRPECPARNVRRRNAQRLGHAAESTDRTASAPRLADDEPRRRQGSQEASGRDGERRRARHGCRRAAALPAATRCGRGDARLSGDGSGERPHRAGARHARQPDLGVDGAHAARRAPIRCAGSTRSARPPSTSSTRSKRSAPRC